MEAHAQLRGGIDLGGTKIEAIVVDEAHTILGQARRLTPTDGGPPAVVAELATAMREAASAAATEISDLAGVGVGAPGEVDMWVEYSKWKAANPEAAEKALSGGLIGSPETIRKKLRRFRTSHIDQVILLNQAGKNSHEHICESLELFAREVMPEFKRDPEHEAWKAGVMSGTIQLEEIDTAAFTDRYGKLAVSVAPKSAAAAG